MPAARGGSRAQAKPQVKAPARPAKRPAAAPRRNLSPKHVLLIAGGVLVLALGVTLATGERGATIAQSVGSGFDNRLGNAGFRVKAIHVEGASALAKADIVRAAGVGVGQPLLGLDLAQVQARIGRVGWVEEARVVRLLPDTLVISVKERRQLAVWQYGGRTFVIDEHGQKIPEADPARFTTLPLVVGAGGAKHAPDILPTIAQRPKLMARMEALVRVDDRRWDLRLKDGSLIQLPAVDQDAALMKLEELDLRSHILDLGFERIDLRNPDAMTVRPRPIVAAVPSAPPAPSQSPA
jgi:cell division protein FtsQ